MGIRSLQMMEPGECKNILEVTDYFKTMETEDRIKYLNGDLRTRLDKFNELIWKKYSPIKLDEITRASEELGEIALSAGNTDMSKNLRIVQDVMSDLVILFKNYEEMMALVMLQSHQVQEVIEKVPDESELEKKYEGVLEELEHLRNVERTQAYKISSLVYVEMKLNEAQKQLALISKDIVPPETVEEISNEEGGK